MNMKLITAAVVGMLALGAGTVGATTPPPADNAAARASAEAAFTTWITAEGVDVTLATIACAVTEVGEDLTAVVCYGLVDGAPFAAISASEDGGLTWPGFVELEPAATVESDGTVEEMTARASELPGMSGEDVQFFVGLCTGEAVDVRTALTDPVLSDVLLQVCPGRVAEVVGS